jgi:hypothetical protein
MNAGSAETTLCLGPGRFTEEASDTRLSLRPVGTAYVPPPACNQPATATTVRLFQIPCCSGIAAKRERKLGNCGLGFDHEKLRQ